MTKLTKTIGIIVLLGLIFVGFVGAVSATDINITINGLTQPVGGTNVLTIDKLSATGSINGVTVGISNLTWSPQVSTKYDYGTVYTATITLSISGTEGENYTIQSNSIGGIPSGATATVNGHTISVVFPATAKGVIDNIIISGIDNPCVGNNPSTITNATITTKIGNTTISGTGASISSLVWSDSTTNLTDSSTFGEGITYTVKINLNLNSNKYEFGTSGGEAKIGKTVDLATSANITSTSRSANTMEITKTYSSLAKEIKTVDITVAAPTTGATPSSTATVKGNTNLTISSSATAKWYEVTGTTPSQTETTSAFEANTKYKVTVTIPKLTGTYANYTYNSPTIKINDHTLSSSDYTITDGVITANYIFSETAKATISSINITNLDSPIVGNTPDVNATATGYLSGSSAGINLPAPSIEWYLSSTKQTSAFEADNKYKVKIVLTPSNDSEFSTSPTIKIGDTTINSSEITATATSITIEHTYAKTDGTIKSISLTTTAPSLDKTMSTSVSATTSPSNSTETPTLTWSPSGNKFEGGKTYTATITIKAKTGYTFGTSPTIKINNNSITSSEYELSSDKTILTVTHKYDKLATPITSVSMKITKPVAGKKAENTVSFISSSPNSKFSSSITWNPAIDESGKFEEETEYKATVTINNEDSDYAFTSDTTATINGETAKVSNPSATKMTVTFTFEETKQEGIISIGEAVVPYPKDFFAELIALFTAVFDINNWKIFKGN